MKKRPSVLLASLFIVPIILVGFIGFFLYSIIKKPAPQFFPLDDANATYTIVKSSFRGNNPPEVIRTDDLNYLYYYVEYKGSHIYLVDGLTSFVILVGQSKVDLKDFVGKSVQIKGDFGSSKRQCIVGQCREIAGPWVVLNVDEVRLR